MGSQIRLHILGAMPKGNVGTVAAQRALYKLLTNNNIDLSVSVTDKKTFKLNHPESKNIEVYGSLQPSIGSKDVHSHLQWAFFTVLNLILFTFMAILMQMRVKFPSKTDVINRMRKCDAFIDLNLELIRGIPISVSPALIKQKPETLAIHKLFWSFRILQNLWFIFVVKGIFRKKLVVGPASFGPFKGLPIVVQCLTRLIMSRFVDLILVREPCSAKLLDELGVKNYQIVADVALIAQTSRPSSQISFSCSKPTVGVVPATLRHTLTKEETDNYIMAHVKCLEDLIKEYEATIIFLPSSLDDILLSKTIIAKMNNAYAHHVKMIITHDVDEYESWIRKLNLLITTRMHPSIIAARNFVPFLSIIYDHKQIGFLLQIGLKTFSLPIGKTSYDTLSQMINYVIQNWSKIRETLESTLPKLQDSSITKLCSILNLIKA